MQVSIAPSPSRVAGLPALFLLGPARAKASVRPLREPGRFPHLTRVYVPCRQERRPPELTNNSTTNSTCTELGAPLASGDAKHVVNLFDSRRKPAWLPDFPRFRNLVAPSHKHCRSPPCNPIGRTLAALRVSPELLSFHQTSIERKSGVQDPVRRQCALASRANGCLGYMVGSLMPCCRHGGGAGYCLTTIRRNKSLLEL